MKKRKIGTFSGPFAPMLDLYVKEKQAVGYDFVGGYSVLKIFDTFSKDFEISNYELTKEIVLAWAKQRPNEHDAHRSNRIMYLQHFATFLNTQGCNGVQREHNKKLNNGLPILHKVPPKRDYGRYFCIMAEKGGTSHGGLTEKLSPFFHAVCPAKLDHTSRCKSGHGNRQ